MNRWSRNTYNWAYRFLCLRDGERCIICRVRPKPGTKLEIDHIDGNISNNDQDNLCLLCKKHNCEMRGKKPVEHKRIIHSYRLQNEREKESNSAIPATQFTREIVDYHSGSAEMQANTLFEPKFRGWIIDKVIAEGEVLKDDALNSGAEVVGCSVQAAKGYLKKMTSSSGILYEAINTFGQVVLRLKNRPYKHTGKGTDENSGDAFPE